MVFAIAAADMHVVPELDGRCSIVVPQQHTAD